MWEEVKKLIGTAAPMVGTLIGGPAGGAVGGLVASALGVENTAAAIEAELRVNPEALLKIKQLESDERIRLQELMFQHAKLESGERQLAITQQAATMQAEMASSDPFVRRWRPTWGYTLCLSWALMFFGLFFVMTFQPQEAANVVNAIVALTPLISIALAVLGVNIHKRSLDKQITAGVKPVGVLGGIRQAVKGG
ncbi:3TM-type holin [Photobacterium sp. 1_MG-2023]|uniref:3TM-type holin n=1 Tax=Photobacterium sp. 1_MG-2023 TaxID=3062646 RepID=UPI0026E241B2|nr:3TM-type holin [Photobacterium sp. 1_MG-2023]MDO6706143.1 3TM-type holin [Photobacterium sp. 1_MG-2023]